MCWNHVEISIIFKCFTSLLLLEQKYKIKFKIKHLYVMSKYLCYLHVNFLNGFPLLYITKTCGLHTNYNFLDFQLI